jgi:ATP-dependent DNA helicase RecQ
MVAYAETTTCLRATILRYFGDPDVHDPCSGCGNCRPQPELDCYERDVVRKILSGIARAGERYGRRRVAAMLLGDKTDLPPALAELSTMGVLRGEQRDALDQWINACVTAGFVVVSTDKYRTLRLTPLGHDVMRGRVRRIPIVRPADAFDREARRARLYLEVMRRRWSLEIDENDDREDDYGWR